MRWFFAFFFVSGFCALVYEVVWLRLAMAAFGVTTPLVSLFLAMYMAGLGLGCWGAGRMAHYFNSRSAAAPLRVYGLTELLIGVSALAVPLQLSWGHRILLGLGGEQTIAAPAFYGFSAVWIALTLVPWCACMGATVPIAMSAIRKGFGASPQSFSYLYLANVLGAVAGTLIPAFLLIEILGFRGTLLLASGLNALLAAAAFSLSLQPRFSSIAGAGSLRVEPSSRGGPSFAPVSLLWLLFATGLISLAMEVVWIRQFTPYLGTVVYAFATILAAYLLATYLGSRVYRRWIRSRSPETSGFLWISLCALALLALVAADPRLPLRNGVHVASFLRVGLGVGGFSAAVGFLTPMLVDRWSEGDPRRAGHAYTVNVLGSIAGPLVAGFALLPWMSEQAALIVLALPLLVIGFVAVRRPSEIGLVSRPSDVPLLASVVALSVVVTVLSKDFEGQFDSAEIRRDATATVIATGQAMDKRLLINGQGITLLTAETKMMAHLPLAFLSRPPRDGIVVGFGMGTSFRSLHSWGGRATAVELLPGVVDLFGYYHADGLSLRESPRARIVVDDGRRFLERSVDQYDVVIVDPPPPVGSAGTSLLYSKEFYSIVKRRLRPGGIVHQWLYLGSEDVEVRASVVRSLVESFPHVRAFQSFGVPGLHFLASMSPIPLDSPSILAARLPARAVHDLLEWGPYDTAEEQFAAVLDGEISLEAILGSAPHSRALEDNWAVNEYYWFRHRLQWLGLR